MKQSETPKTQEVLAGLVERVTEQSLETEGGERKPTARRPRAKAEPEKKPKGRKKA